MSGQTTDEIKVTTRQVFEYVYRNFTDPNSRKYLEDIQLWLYFRRWNNRKDYSIPVLDHTGKEYPELINWTLHRYWFFAHKCTETPRNKMAQTKTTC